MTDIRKLGRAADSSAPAHAADALYGAQQEAAEAAQAAQQQVAGMEADLKLRQAEQREAEAKLEAQAEQLRQDLEVAR
jgi:hypothetical protein